MHSFAKRMIFHIKANTLCVCVCVCVCLHSMNHSPCDWNIDVTK